MEHIRRYFPVYCIVSIIIAGLAKWLAASYELIPTTINTLINDQVSSISYYKVSPIYPILDWASTLFVALSISLLVTQVFARALNKAEQEKRDKKYDDYLKEISRNAVESTFERLIDKEFLEIIKKDVFQSDFVRKDVRWYFDISTIISGADTQMKLSRTLHYKSYNIGLNNADEHIYLSYLECGHCTSRPVSLKYRIDGANDFIHVDPERQEDGSRTITLKKGIAVPPNKFVEMVIVFEQIYPRAYIFDTHFLNRGAINLELTVNFPNNYKFDLNASVFGSRVEKTVNEPTKHSYRINGAIYRGQGLEFTCFPIRDN